MLEALFSTEESFYLFLKGRFHCSIKKPIFVHPDLNRTNIKIWTGQEKVLLISFYAPSASL